MPNPTVSPLRYSTPIAPLTLERESLTDNAFASPFTKSVLRAVDTDVAGAHRQAMLEAQLAQDDDAARAEAYNLERAKVALQRPMSGPQTWDEASASGNYGDYVQNALGNAVGSMAKPLIASGGLGLVGGVPGSVLGSLVGSASAIRNAELVQYMEDPQLASLSAKDQLEATRKSALLQAIPEAILPAYIGAGGKLPGALSRMPGALRLAGEVATEAGTEGLQDYLSQRTAQGYFPDRQMDWDSVRENAIQGAIGGGGLGLAMHHDAGHSKSDALSRQAEAAAARTPPPEPGIDPNAPVDLGGPDAPGGGFGEGFTAGREAAMDLGRRVRGAAATKVDDFLDNLANPSPIDQLRDDLIPDDAHPDILDAADTGTALVVRDNAKAQRAQITAMKILADPDIPDLIKDQIRGLNGDYSSETARSLINSTALGKQVFDKTSDVLSDLAKDMSAFGRRTFKPNLQDVPLQDLNDLTQLVASKLGPKANEAPKLVQQMVALTARLSPDGSTEGIAKRLQSLSDAIGEDVIAELGKATGNKSIAADLKKLSLIPDIRNDVAKSEGKSFFESMLATPLNNADKRTAIQATQSALREYERAGEDRRRFIENKLGEHLFGNAERAKTVIQYYHNMEQQSRAKDELRFAPGEDEGPSTLTEQDAVLNDAKYRDNNVARPFFGKFDGAAMRKALRTARAAYGMQNVRSGTYADFVDAHPDRNAGVEAARIRSDLSKRLVDNENRDTATVQQAISVLESIPESERSDDHGELLAALKGRKTEDRSKQLTRLRKEMSAIKKATGVDVGELNRLRSWVRSETTKKMERKYGAADRGEANRNIRDNIDTMDRVELSRFIERHTKKLEGIADQDSDLAGWISSEIDYAKERQSGIESGKVVENKEDSPEVASAKAKIASMEKALSDNAPKMLGLYRTIIHPRDDTYASDEKLSRFRKLLDEGRNINVQDKPENKQRRADIAATRVTFKTKDGKDLNLSLESMVHNSGVFGSIEERLFSAIASVMAHPDMDKNSFQTPRDDAIVMRGKHGADHVYWGDLVHKDLEQALSDQKERIEGRKDWTEAQREAFAKRREKGEKQRASDRQKRAKQDIRTRGDLQQIVQELNVDALTERLKGQLGKNGLTLEKIEAATKADNPVEALISLFPAARRQAARRQAARNALDYMLGEAQRISDIKPKYRSAEDHSALRVLNAEIKSELGDLYPMDLGTKRRLADTREESGGRDGHKNVGAELLHHEAMIESLMDRLHEVAGVPSLEAYYNAWISGLEKTYEAIRSGASGESRTPMVENRENLYAEIAGRREKTAGPTPADLRTKAKILRAAAKGDKLAPLAKPKRSEAQIERELGDLEASFAPGGTMASLTAAEKADMRAAFGPERSVETGKLRPAEELLEEAEALEAQADAIQRKSEGPPKTGPRSTLARQKAALNKLVKRGLAAERDGTYYLREAESSKHAVLKLSDGTVIINMGRINAAPEKVLRKFLDDKKLLLGEARLSPERLLDVLGKNPRRVASFMRDVLKKDTIADALSPQERDAAWAGKGLRPPPKATKREEANAADQSADYASIAKQFAAEVKDEGVIGDAVSYMEDGDVATVKLWRDQVAEERDELAVGYESYNPETGEYQVSNGIMGDDRLTYERLDATVKMYDALLKASRSKYSTIGAAGKKMTPEQRKAVIKEIRRLRGKDVKIRIEKLIEELGYSGSSDKITKDDGTVERIIEIALNAKDPMSVAWHESLHDFFAMLGEDRTGRSIKRDLINAANAPHVRRKLEKLLAAHPEALKQIKNDPEERVAYMYQFWAAGEPNMVGPTGTNIFQKLRQFFFDMFKIATSDQRAEDILTAFHEGKFADERVVAEVLADLPRDTVRNRIERFSPALSDFLHATAQIAPDRLRDFQNEEISALADKLEQLVRRRFQQQGVWENKLADILAGTTAVERRAAVENMQARKDPSSPLEKKLAEFYKGMYDYMSKSGVETYSTKDKKWMPLRQVGDYFPRSWDPAAIQKDPQGFIALLAKHGNMSPAASKKLIDAIVAGDGRLELAEDEHSLGFTPFAKAAIDRQLTFINKANAADFAKYQQKDLMDITSTYIRQAVHRAEYAKLFENDGSGLAKHIEASGITDKKDLEAIDNSIRAMEGTLNQDKLSLGTKNLMSGAMTLQNITLLPLAIFSQSIDPIVMAARTGDLKDAGNAYVTALKRLRNFVGKSKDKVPGEELAEMLGIISQDSVLEAMGYAYGSTYMNRPLTKINRTFFKWNGMQGWNNSMRIAATVAGEKYLLANRSNAKALEELGLEPSDIQVLQAYNNGVRGEGLDYSNPKIREAMYQFVDQAVLRPSAANRPVWMSDPRFQLVAHLKQFTFAMHNVVLKRATQQADEGNHVPWAILGLTVPVILAADMAKFALTGTTPANWGFMDYLVHSVERSGILGLGDFSVQATRGMDSGAAPGEGLLGPTLENLFKILRWAGGDPRVKFEDVLDRTVPGAKFV